MPAVISVSGLEIESESRGSSRKQPGANRRPSPQAVLHLSENSKPS